MKLLQLVEQHKSTNIETLICCSSVSYFVVVSTELVVNPVVFYFWFLFSSRHWKWATRSPKWPLSRILWRKRWVCFKCVYRRFASQNSHNNLVLFNTMACYNHFSKHSLPDIGFSLHFSIQTSEIQISDSYFKAVLSTQQHCGSSELSVMFSVFQLMAAGKWVKLEETTYVDPAGSTRYCSLCH